MAELLAAAASITEVPRIVPRIRVVGDLVYLLLPGDPGFDGGPIDPSTDTQAWLHADGTVNTADLSSGSEEGGGMVSFNHYAAGAVGDWMYRRKLFLKL